MKKYTLYFFFLLISSSGFAQLVFNTSYHNFGEVNKQDGKYYDFTLTNAGTQEAKILRVEEPYGVSVRFSSKVILPDSTITVRIKYTPKRKELFKVDIPVWVNIQNQPITFTLEGDAKTFDIKESLQSPDFISTKKIDEDRTELQIKVIDINTKQPINNATIEIIWDGLVYKQLKTNRSGETSQTLKNDAYYFVVNAEGYGTEEQAIEINSENNSVTFLMGEPKPEELIVEKVDTVIEEPFVPEPKDTISTAEMPVSLYAENNIVFLIDASVSMKQEGRMDLLKAAMIELLNGLRSIDKLAIVTYASTVEVVLESQFVKDKAQITQIIQDLSAGGRTAGAQGLQKAYEVALQNKLTEGNNLIILATDGAFNLSKGDKANVEQNAASGIYISVVGVKNEKWTEKSMLSISESGKGSYLSIKSYKQAKETLLNEIKAKSKKK